MARKMKNKSILAIFSSKKCARLSTPGSK